jgi:hypothetical protein
VGVARARTPILPEELAGPVYLISRGRNVFPSPVLVLQDAGVQLRLAGATVVDSRGIASVAFNAIPDVPIESLRLYLPRGPHSILTANTNLCALTRTVAVRHNVSGLVGGRTVRRVSVVHKRLPASLSMPSELVAQNGGVVRKGLRVAVSGCARSAKAARRLPGLVVR